MASSTPTEGRREPFLHRLSEDAGLGFAIGAIGGSILHYGKGFLRPKTGTGRLRGGFQNIQRKAPLTAGCWARFTIVYSLVENAVAHVRKKEEDPYNTIITSFVTGGLLACRKGLAATAASSLGFGLVGILGEGVMALGKSNQMVQKGVDFPDSTHAAARKLLEVQRGIDDLMVQETSDSLVVVLE
ncbi:translocase of the inner membrane [Ranunculus cassubicifolius]